MRDLNFLADVKALKNRPISANEIAWIVFLRLLTNDTDPKPTLGLLQALRLALKGR